jgi:hypothetical protein
MTGEQRVQRRVECPFDDVNLGDECHLSSFLPTCRGCNNDGTRWATVGELHQAMSEAGSFDWNGRLWTNADDGLRPLYVVVEPS